jgi:hypothetical protein
MWKTLVGKFQPPPVSLYSDPQIDQELESSWDERDTTGATGMPENAASQAELTQYVYTPSRFYSSTIPNVCVKDGPSRATWA